jgi:hypothetical protein
MYAGAGSIGIVALARSAILVGMEPGDCGRRVAAQFKSNAGPRAPALAFKVLDEAGGRRLEWLGPSEFTAEQLVNISASDVSAIEEAAMLLIAALSDGPMWVSDIKKVAAKSGVSKRTLDRAKALLKITSHREGYGAGSQVFWVLPDHGVLVKQLKERELDTLMDALVSGQQGPPKDAPNGPPPRRRPPRRGDDDDSGDADWWKQPT